MGEQTKISWAHHTFNPWWGCERVSPGCGGGTPGDKKGGCYAEAFSKRIGLKVWGQQAPRRFFGDKHWAEPLKWTRAAREAGERRRVFCGSMCDWAEDREDLVPHRARLFRLIAETCDALDWMLLTKRPENVARLGDLEVIKHCWLGTTAENQEWADRRIPILLSLPAAVRFVSCEPLLGPIDLAGWGDAAPLTPDPKWKDLGWEDFEWEEWVPVDCALAVEKFWSKSNCRGPWDYLRDQVIQQVPRTGARVTFAREGNSTWLCSNKMAAEGVSGRYVHMWNNIGRVVGDDGIVYGTGGGHGSGWLSKWYSRGEYRPKLNLVIVGSESGNGARPMELAWARSIVDQCVAAGVSVWTKQIATAHDKKGENPEHWPPGNWPRQMPEVRHG